MRRYAAPTHMLCVFLALSGAHLPGKADAADSTNEGKAPDLGGGLAKVLAAAAASARAGQRQQPLAASSHMVPGLPEASLLQNGTNGTAAAAVTTPVPTPAPTPPPVARWAQGGLATMHGCECMDTWQFNGLTLNGCVFTNGVRVPWCFVKDAASCTEGYTKDQLSELPSVNGNSSNTTTDGTWDFCTLPEEVAPHFTRSGCHCLPRWEFEGKAYSGCNRTEEGAGGNASDAWCYVAETASNCAGASAPADAKKHRWDACDPPKESPAFLTKHSCHCKPKWKHEGSEYTSCLNDETVPPPRSINTTNTSVKASLLGWCQVFEDERGCAAAEITGAGVMWDSCFFLDEANKKELTPTLHGCHCLPEWELDGASLTGCQKTQGASASWCPVAEDGQTCSNSLGPDDATDGAGRGGHRWDWCSEDSPKDPSEPWRLASERFAPKDPNPPAWYSDIYEDMKQKFDDWHTGMHMGQATWLRRRRAR